MPVYLSTTQRYTQHHRRTLIFGGFCIRVGVIRTASLLSWRGVVAPKLPPWEGGDVAAARGL